MSADTNIPDGVRPHGSSAAVAPGGTDNGSFRPDPVRPTAVVSDHWASPASATGAADPLARRDVCCRCLGWRRCNAGSHRGRRNALQHWFTIRREARQENRATTQNDSKLPRRRRSHPAQPALEKPSGADCYVMPSRSATRHTLALSRILPNHAESISAHWDVHFPAVSLAPSLSS
jgi:hypothetical protein